MKPKKDKVKPDKVKPDKWKAGRKVSSRVIVSKADEFAESVRDKVEEYSSGVYKLRGKDREGLDRYGVIGEPPSATEVAKGLNKAGVLGPQGKPNTWTARAVINHWNRIARIDAQREKEKPAVESDSARAIRERWAAEDAEEAAWEEKIREKIAEADAKRAERMREKLTPEQFEQWQAREAMIAEVTAAPHVSTATAEEKEWHRMMADLHEKSEKERMRSWAITHRDRHKTRP